jgi:hypothetical protein
MIYFDIVQIRFFRAEQFSKNRFFLLDVVLSRRQKRILVSGGVRIVIDGR